MSLRKVLRPFALAACFLTLVATTTRAQQRQGTITGRVTNAATGQPIAGAQLQVVGTNAGTQSSSDGSYTLRNVNPGTLTVRVLRVGFAEARFPVTVQAGQGATLAVQMREVPVTLSPVVTTATGEQRRVEVGNAIAQIDAAADVQSRPVANLGDLLTARAPGVQVLPATQTGNGTRVRIRGTSSLSLSNNPIYIIDGVRMESSTGSSSLSVGGSTVARTGDLNPEEIESIEVVRGPSAATLYGTDAANGVIVIRTKRGVAGRPQWTYYTEQTAVTDRNPYPDAYRAWRTGTTSTTNSLPSNSVQCFLTQVASGACKQDSVTKFNLFKDPETTPYGVGYRYQHGLQLRGGSDAIRYFVHGEIESEDGPTKVPEFDRRWLSAHNVSFLPEQTNPNGLVKRTARSNLNITLPWNADLAANLGFISQDVRLPMSDDSGVSGIGANVYGGQGYKYATNSAGDTLWGWRQFTPRDIYQGTTNQKVNRTLASLNANWRPQEWLALRGNFGADYTMRHETQICRFQNCPDVGTDRLGYKNDNRANFYTYTVDVGGTGTYRFTPAIESKTTVGAQYFRNLFNRNGANGVGLPPGAVTVTAAGTKNADETTSESRTLGAFVEEAMAFNDRLFVTGAVRSDRNSAFGKNFKTVFYPKVSVSWVASQEPFFPALGWLNQLRLRGAYGASGVQPGNNDAVPFYIGATARMESGDAVGSVIQTLGNANLKPERSTETELGLDGTFLNNRLNVELTHYDKRSRDALISRVLPPSLGSGATSRLENLGEVRNWGWEGLITGQLIRREKFGWDMALNGSNNSNDLVNLGGVPPIVSSSTIQQRQGFPLNGWWTRKLVSWEDKDKNGIITYNADPNLSEIVVSDSAQFHGYSIPKTEIAFTNGFDLLKNRVRLAAMLDYKGGHKGYYNTERIRCSSRLNCRGLIDPTASLEEQARSVALRDHPSRTTSGYMMPADFIRFRELALSGNAPETWAHHLKARSAQLTLSARNLGILWTRYGGVDPEATFGATGDSPSEFQAAGPQTYFSLRLSLGF